MEQSSFGPCFHGHAGVFFGAVRWIESLLAKFAILAFHLSRLVWPSIPDSPAFSLILKGWLHSASPDSHSQPLTASLLWLTFAPSSSAKPAPQPIFHSLSAPSPCSAITSASYSFTSMGLTSISAPAAMPLSTAAVSASLSTPMPNYELD